MFRVGWFAVEVRKFWMEGLQVEDVGGFVESGPVSRCKKTHTILAHVKLPKPAIQKLLSIVART